MTQLRQRSGAYMSDETVNQVENGAESDDSQRSKSSNVQCYVENPLIRSKPYTQTSENFTAVVSFTHLRCLLCKKSFSARKNLVHHARLFHRSALNAKCIGAKSPLTLPFKCKICGHQFQWKSSLWRHKKEKHSSYAGSINDVIASDSPFASMTNSEPVHVNETQKETVVIEPVQNAYSQPMKPFQCDFCEVRFTGMKARRKHIRLKHPDRDPLNKNRTGVLDLSSKEYDELLGSSYMSSSPPGFYPCPDCGVQFRIKSSMMSHRARKHGKRDNPDRDPNRSWQCNQCGARFNLELSLKVHVTKKHGRPKPDRPEPGITLASHSYETKSAIRARNESARSIVEDLQDDDSFVVQQNGVESEDSESKFGESCGSINSSRQSSSSRVWVNPRLAEYEKISDISTLTCKICLTQYADRKKLFLHLNRCHMTGQSPLKTAIFEDEEEFDENEVLIHESNMANGAMHDSARTCRKVRDYSKICDFDTLSCKLCPRQCNSMSQLQNHALYKHVDMVELVPMKQENGVSYDSQSDSLDLSLDKVETDSANGDPPPVLARNTRASDKQNSEVSDCWSSGVNGEQQSVLATNQGTAKKSSIYYFGDYVILESHTCLLCNKSLTTTSNLLRHMVSFHKSVQNVLGTASNGKSNSQDDNLDGMDC